MEFKVVQRHSLGTHAKPETVRHHERTIPIRGYLDALMETDAIADQTGRAQRSQEEKNSKEEEKNSFHCFYPFIRCSTVARQHGKAMWKLC
jgi:hypothetical protein